MVENEGAIYNLVYDYYETRIIIGVCRYGESLPSISRIAKYFQMAPRSVRAGLTRLEKKGYIQINPRRLAVVKYKIDADQMKQNAARYFVPRMAGLADFDIAGKLLIEPILKYAQRTLDEALQVQIKEKLMEVGSVELPVAIRHHIYIFTELKNKLIMNFYWEVLRYMRFPYLFNHSMHEVRNNELLQNRKENETELMKETFEVDYRERLSYLQTFCSWAQNEYDLKEEGQVPFCWNIYWQRPQLCYTAVSRIILEIIRGTYPVGSTLPSMPIMSKQLNISYRTLRRTLSILSGLGIIQLHQGKAAEVCMEIKKIDFSRQEVKEGFRIYRESLQFMELTIRPVILYTFENIKKEECNHLTTEFVQLFSQNTCQRCFKLVLDFIVDKCPSNVVCECYKNLSEFLVWGYPFALYRLKKEHFQKEYVQIVRETVKHLKSNNWEGFADSWSALMGYEHENAEKVINMFIKN